MEATAAYDLVHGAGEVGETGKNVVVESAIICSSKAFLFTTVPAASIPRYLEQAEIRQGSSRQVN